MEKEEKLTIEKLEAMKPNTIFASGIGKTEHPWFNDAKNIDENNETPVKWIAIRGGIGDWAIYHSMDANICTADYFDCECHLNATEEIISSLGAKLHNMEKVKEFVPCDEDALQMYRH